jgi:hypothetical protein
VEKLDSIVATATKVAVAITGLFAVVKFLGTEILGLIAFVQEAAGKLMQ